MQKPKSNSETSKHEVCVGRPWPDGIDIIQEKQHSSIVFIIGITFCCVLLAFFAVYGMCTGDKGLLGDVLSVVKYGLIAGFAWAGGRSVVNRIWGASKRDEKNEWRWPKI